MYRPSSISVAESWLTFLVLVLASALAFRSLIPPAAVPVSAPTSDFSAERAFKHLEYIAREPHPTGSVANSRVRDYLVEQLKSLGLEPQIQKAVAATSRDIGGGTLWHAAIADLLSSPRPSDMGYRPECGCYSRCARRQKRASRGSGCSQQALGVHFCRVAARRCSIGPDREGSRHSPIYRHRSS
jgi:hypothetical protein